MLTPRIWTLAVLFPALTLSFPPPQSPAPQSQTMTARQKKQQEARLRKELNSGYTRWLDQDVVWIISDDERHAFARLQNDEEREQFIEQFWLRRDPTPDTIENEFREEHYRRIAYANERFASGIPGWRTDRGRIYIAWGPPDERDEHPSGGTYQRTPEEGGGMTSTFPFEIWRYRHLEGVDSDVNLEFIDPTLSGEYRLTIDPCAKDALQYVPGAGPTLREQTGQSTRAERFTNTNGTTCGPAFGGQSERNNQFRRLEVMSKVFAPPPVKFNDLKSVVESTVSYRLMPVDVQVNYFPLTDASVLTYITLQFENQDLQFRSVDGVERATVNVLGRVSAMTRRPVLPFEASVVAESPSRLFEQFARGRSIYNTAITLRPGSYRLDIAAKDVVGGNATHYQAALSVPRLEPDRLQTSGIVLADVMEKAAARSIGAGQFVLGDTKVRPRVNARFRRDERLGVYGKIYNFTPGASGQAVYELLRGDQVVSTVSEDLPKRPGAEVTIERFLDLADLAPGAYTVRVKITDNRRAATVTASAAFTVI